MVSDPHRQSSRVLLLGMGWESRVWLGDGGSPVSHPHPASSISGFSGCGDLTSWEQPPVWTRLVGCRPVSIVAFLSGCLSASAHWGAVIFLRLSHSGKAIQEAD